MKQVLIILIGLTNLTTTHAQFSDSFSDGNINQNPIWIGDTSDFIIDSNRLRLSAVAKSDTSKLMLPSKAIVNASWEFDILLDFNPSSSNYSKIYLAANDSLMNSGIFLEIGGSNDAISLYFQDAINDSLIWTSQDALIKQGIWYSIDIQSSLSQWFIYFEDTLLASIPFNIHHPSKFFGLFCKYTSTRSDKFYFDNFLVSGDPYKDTLAPILDHYFLKGDSMTFLFSEMLDTSQAVYVLDNISKQQSDLVFINSTKAVAIQNWPRGIKNNYRLTEVKDTSGNFSAIEFETDLPQWKDLIVTEIMFEPDTSSHDFPFEYVEVFNKSSNQINLSNWSFSDAVSSHELDSFIVLPKTYALLFDEKYQHHFDSSISRLPCRTWPSLNNSGDKISLQDPSGYVIDELTYSPNWYQNPLRDDGGYSLELNSLETPCPSKYYWQASSNIEGGSPGLENSNDDWELAPTFKLNQASLRSGDTLELKFNRPLSKLYHGNQVGGVEQQKLLLPLESILDSHKIYERVIDKIQACDASVLNQMKVQYGISSVVHPNDIVINEVLFNPLSYGSDYLELKNRSNKLLDLRELFLVNGFDDLDVVHLSEEQYWSFPGDLHLITSDSLFAKEHYSHSCEDCFIELSTPEMPDDTGYIRLTKSSGIVIDEFQYHHEMHHPRISDANGVSLERLNCNESSSNPQNWMSAAFTVGYGSPGLENSQYAEEVISLYDLSIDPEQISPDGDGVNDYLTISSQMPDVLSTATMRIYDIQGSLVREMLNNELLPKKSAIIWDGVSDNGALVKNGIYFVSLELYSESGKSACFRKAFSVNSRYK